MPTALTRMQVAALLAVAQDHAFGQPPGSQLRATVLAQHLADAAGLDPGERATTWWASAFRFLGCTGHAFEVAALFGDEIELRGRSLRVDAANPADMLRLMIGHAGPGLSGLPRLRPVAVAVATGRRGVEYNFRTACEVADALAARLGLDLDARRALATSFERWNGRGVPNGIAGTAIPRPMRIAQLAQEFEVLARLEGVPDALQIVRARHGRAYDPELTDLLFDAGPAWWAAVEPADPWDSREKLRRLTHRVRALHELPTVGHQPPDHPDTFQRRTAGTHLTHHERQQHRRLREIDPRHLVAERELITEEGREDMAVGRAPDVAQQGQIVDPLPLGRIQPRRLGEPGGQQTGMQPLLYRLTHTDIDRQRQRRHYLGEPDPGVRRPNRHTATVATPASMQAVDFTGRRHRRTPDGCPSTGARLTRRGTRDEPWRQRAMISAELVETIDVPPDTVFGELGWNPMARGRTRS